ncbi:6067_t:CDS:1 [Paraglomus brasilianum]|uniref:6067_t:CDS:1 n=1 Tax=Paraglomus brasilianum TaxID=144538 RepID=A0A9N9BEL6_9GLOM|nr:6067_t:CDS:1 [Paraglomus brasilianum]
MDVLQNPIPLYLLGAIPALFVAGHAPFSTLTSKFLHILVCLGCPFTPLFYFLHVEAGVSQDGVDNCAYWLPAAKFEYRDGENGVVRRWPFGFKTKSLDFTRIPDIKARLAECLAKISFLDIFACFVSSYFIFVGIIIGIYRALGPCQEQDWPAIPLLLSWTLPILAVRVFKGKAVVKDPEEALEPIRGYISLNNNGNKKPRDILGTVLFTLLGSIAVNWAVVILTYYTKPQGFGCRSLGLSVVAGVWSFNSILSFIYYYLLNNPPPGVDESPIYLWLCTCGIMTLGFFIFFGVISNNPEWWVAMFGNSCDASCLATSS